MPPIWRRLRKVEFMRRKNLLLITGIAEKHFETLQRRDQLPFVSSDRPWGQYELADAFRLKLMLGLLAHPPRHDGSAVSPAFAATVIGNCIGYAAERFGSADPTAFLGHDEPIWIAAVEFADFAADEPTFSTAWFCGPFAELPRWAEERVARDAAQGWNSQLSRVCCAIDVTAAAASVIARAEALGLLDGEDDDDA